MINAVTNSFCGTLVRKASTVSTIVTFPKGEIRGASRVLNVATSQDKRIALLLESTPFHPVDRHWPDQPADKGSLSFLGNGKTFNVIDCEILASNIETGEVIIGKDVPKAEKSKWNFIVGHIIESDDTDPASLIDSEVMAEVDATYRKQLCLHHSASHLAAFALNLATRGYWSKDASKDTLGSPNFDQLAMESSFIHADRCEDTYRFGTTIKKKNGLKVEEIFKDVAKIQDQVNETLRGWLSNQSKVEILTEGGNKLNDTRKWHCELPVGTAEMPCGGTHVSSLSEIASIDYTLNVVTEGKEKKLFASARAKATDNIK